MTLLERFPLLMNIQLCAKFQVHMSLGKVFLLGDKEDSEEEEEEEDELDLSFCHNKNKVFGFR